MQNFRELSQQLDLKPDANRKPVQLFVSAVYLFSLSGVLFYVHHPSIRALLFTASKTIVHQLRFPKGSQRYLTKSTMQ